MAAWCKIDFVEDPIEPIQGTLYLKASAEWFFSGPKSPVDDCFSGTCDQIDSSTFDLYDDDRKLVGKLDLDLADVYEGELVTLSTSRSIDRDGIVREVSAFAGSYAEFAADVADVGGV